MTRRAPLLRHAAAGRIEPGRLAVRWRALDPGAPACLAEAPLAPGARLLGPFTAALAFDVGEESVAIDPALTNTSGAPLRLEALVIGLRWTPPDAHALRYLRNGWQSWSFTGSRDLDDAGERSFPSGPWLRGMFHALGAPPDDRMGWHESDLLTVIGPGAGGAALLAGVLEQGRSFGVVFARRDGDDILVEIELRLDAEAAPHERFDLERVRVRAGEDASRLLEGFADELGRISSARVRRPFQAGWCSWYHFFHDVTEQDVLRNLDALGRARDEIPITLVQLDDGYQRAIGDWLETNEKFPRGLAPLAADIRSAGFDAGLWTAPFCVAPDSALFAAERHWLLRAGDALFCGLLHPMWTPSARIHVLDASRDEVRTHLASLFRELTAMGFTYQKLDFLYSEAMEADAFDPTLSRAGRLRLGLEAIRSGCGDETFVLGCGCPLGPAVGIVDGMRIGPDVAPSWEIEDEPAIPGIETTRPATRNGVRSILARAWMHRRLWLNDPDCLMSRIVDTRLTRDETRTLAVSIAATGGMVLFSDDVPKLAGESRELVAETLRLAREVDEAAEVGVARAPGLLAAEFADLVVSPVQGGALVALVNAGDAPIVRRVDPRALGFEEGSASLEGTFGLDLSLDAGAATVSLAPHASALLRIRCGAPLAVFCDFDGTFLVQDVGSTLARRFAAERRLQEWDRLQRGEITAWEYTVGILDGLPLPEEALEEFLQGVTLDPGARALLDWCTEQGAPFRVLSDGYDRNLARLQEIHGVRFAFDANRLRYEDGCWRISPARPDARCGCGTGNCKRGRIEAYRSKNPGMTVVHIGNGRVSDLCGALAADLVFAKGSLADALDERSVAFERFDTLHDVVKALATWIANPRDVRDGRVGRDVRNGRTSRNRQSDTDR
ncbi:MAG: alpha-galactosidase [Deltaproteobacteria bacterium]|nr:alpha-galactosidase [Deltaproteobacteria bacterium]